MLKKQFPSGRYYIGDPCYVVSDDNWEQLLGDTDFFEREDQSYKGYQILAGGTTWGDGTYTDQYGRKCSVDSATIGIVPMEATDNKYGNIEELGIIVEFKDSFIAEIDNGVFKFGDIVIDTNDEDEEDEKYYHWD